MPGTLVTLGTGHAWNAFRWGMSSPHRKAFQACPVPNVTNVPGIPGPKWDQRSRHTWSLL